MTAPAGPDDYFTEMEREREREEGWMKNGSERLTKTQVVFLGIGDIYLPDRPNQASKLDHRIDLNR